MKQAFRIGTRAAALFSVFLLAACTQSSGSGSGSGGGDSHYPVTVKNCGAEVTFDSAPERLVLLKPAPVAALKSIGVLDRGVARAGAFEKEYFDDETLKILDDVPKLAGDVDSSGHLQISADVVVDKEPDLLLGEVENLPRDQMEKLDIPLIEEPAFCSDGGEDQPSWDSVYDQMGVYGEVFDREDEAEQAVEKLKERVSAAGKKADSGEERTAAVLYPTVGGGTTYAYGKGSMAHPQLESAGFKNAFEDSSERVFEVTSEEIIGRDPDVIILLYSEGDPKKVKKELVNMSGAEKMTAVKDDEIMPQLLNFTEPATPLAVDGLEDIVERFHK